MFEIFRADRCELAAEVMEVNPLPKNKGCDVLKVVRAMSLEGKTRSLMFAPAGM